MPIRLPFFLLLVPFYLIMLAGCQSVRPVSQPVEAMFSISGNFEGKSYMTTLWGTNLQAAPRWLFTHDIPPLTPGAAKRAAMNRLPDVVGDSAQWQIEAISLIHPFDDEMGEGHWVYEINFSGPRHEPQSGLDQNSDLALLVLMNGAVVLPKPVAPFDSTNVK